MNKYLLGIWLINLSSLGFSLPVQAKVFYVDYDHGSDLSSGQNKAAAWQHSPGDEQATGLVAEIELEPGDTIIFKGGVRYRGSIKVQWSGAVDLARGGLLLMGLSWLRGGSLASPRANVAIIQTGISTNCSMTVWSPNSWWMGWLLIKKPSQARSIPIPVAISTLVRTLGAQALMV